jgi:hypothetical protein
LPWAISCLIKSNVELLQNLVPTFGTMLNSDCTAEGWKLFEACSKTEARFLFVLLLLVGTIQAELVSYGACQTGCNGLVVACYNAAGATFGVTPAAGAPALVGCVSAQGSCMATFAPFLLVPFL